MGLYFLFLLSGAKFALIAKVPGYPDIQIYSGEIKVLRKVNRFYLV